MSLLSAADIKQMRDVTNQTMDGTAIVLAKGFVSDGAGDGTVSWSPAGTVPCHISPVTGLEREIAERITSDAEWVATVPALTAVTTKNQFQESGRTFSIEAVRSPRTWELTRRLELKEIVA